MTTELLISKYKAQNEAFQAVRRGDPYRTVIDPDDGRSMQAHYLANLLKGQLWRTLKRLVIALVDNEPETAKRLGLSYLTRKSGRIYGVTEESRLAVARMITPEDVGIFGFYR